MKITPHYAEMNRQLHASREDFGAGGKKWASQVEHLATTLNTTSILDYGCGKGLLAKALPGLPIREYDPAVRGKDEEPAPAELVVCTDVLEHIEPDCLQDVLDHLQSLSLKMCMAVIHIGPAVKTLPDGRNAHLSQNTPQWWVEQMNKRFELANLQFPLNTLVILGRRPNTAMQ